MTAPTYVAAGTLSSTTSQVSSFTPALPTGWAQNDIFLLFVAGFENPGTPSLTLPGGWTQVTNSPAIEASSTNWCSYYWKRAGSSESAPSVTSSSANMFCAQIYGVRGSVTTGTPVEALTYTDASGGGTSISHPSITTSGADELVLLHLYGLNFNSTTATISGQTNANLTGITERVDTTFSSGFNNVACYTGAKATAGATGATTATFSTSVTEWVAVTHAFKSNSLQTVNGSDVTPAAADTAAVSATIAAADTGSGVDGASQSTTNTVVETGTGLDTASVLFGSADSGSFAESTKVVANGATLAFGTDTGAAAESATIRVTDTDTASTLEVGYVGYQGALPPGPRIVRVMATTNITQEA